MQVSGTSTIRGHSMSTNPLQLLASRRAGLIERLTAAITILNGVQSGSEVRDTTVTTYLESILCVLYLERRRVVDSTAHMCAVLHCLIGRSYLIVHHNPGLWEIHQRTARQLLPAAAALSWWTVAIQSQTEAYAIPLPEELP